MLCLTWLLRRTQSQRLNAALSNGRPPFMQQTIHSEALKVGNDRSALFVALNLMGVQCAKFNSRVCVCVAHVAILEFALLYFIVARL